MGKAAEMAGVTLYDILDQMHIRKIPIGYTAEDLERDLREPHVARVGVVGGDHRRERAGGVVRHRAQDPRGAVVLVAEPMPGRLAGWVDVDRHHAPDGARSRSSAGSTPVIISDNIFVNFNTSAIEASGFGELNSLAFLQMQVSLRSPVRGCAAGGWEK